MGTGKTLSLLWATDILFNANKLNKVLIICPLSTMRAVWGKEIFFNIPHRRYEIAHGTRDARLRAISSPVHYVIINHDGVRNFLDPLIRENFSLVIIDEMTAFKSHSSERSKALQKLTSKVPAVWAATGEPTPNSPLEAYMQAKIVNPYNRNLPRYFTQYRDLTMYQINEYVWAPKPQAPNVVTAILQPSIRYTREECIDLPPTIIETFDVDFTADQKLAYDKMAKELYLQVDEGQISAVNAAVALNKLLQIGAGAVKTNDGVVHTIDSSIRLNALYEIFEQTPQRQLVVFSTFVASIKMIVEFFRSKKVSTAAIYGDIDQKERGRLIDQFQSNEISVLVLQPQSSAHGITLTSASTIVWYSLIASNELYQQGNARIIRPGQTRKTMIIRFVSSKAEKHIASILERKGDMSKETLQLLKNKSL